MFLMRLAPEICWNALQMEQERGQSKIDALVMRNKNLRDANFIDTWVDQVRDYERKRESKTGCSNRRITMSSDPHGPGLIQGGFVGNVREKFGGHIWEEKLAGRHAPHIATSILKKSLIFLGLFWRSNLVI